jgi:hypothetical protein
MTGIFLDRRILLDELTKGAELRADNFLDGILNSYDSISYETFGASGIESILGNIANLSNKLIGVRPRDLALSPEEKALFDHTLSIAAVRPSIVQAAKEYQRSSHSNADPMDSVSYAMRLLGAGRDGNVDIGVHQARLPIIERLFEESGVQLQQTTAGNLILSGPCGFPHLPQASPGNTVYRLLTLGADHRPAAEATSSPPGAVAASSPGAVAASSPPGGDPQIGKRIFIAYSHQDQIWLDRLLQVLSPLIREGEIDAWSDQRINPGQEWLGEIDQALGVAHVGVMLVSAPFLASDFIVRHEVPALLERHRQGKAAVTWIALSASLYKYTAVERFQALNNPDRPLAELSPARRQREIVNIVQKIREMLVGSTAP